MRSVAATHPLSRWRERGWGEGGSVSCPLDRPRQVAKANEPTVLKAQDFEAFLAALDAPAKAKPALKRALKRHAALVRR